MTSKHGSLFAGLPAPAKGALTVYVFGPGFGEAQVVALPDGKWVVVDACVHGGVNLPLELLRHFDVPAIDLLAVTHADLDHYKGLPDLVAHGNVQYGWRYPGFQTARDILLELEKEEPEPGFVDARRMSDALLPLMRAGRCPPVWALRDWSSGDGYCVTAIAPCTAESAYEGERLSALFNRIKRGEKLTRPEKRRLMGEANRLSLAIVIWWGEVGVLLGGDVEHDDGNSQRGWSGVLEELKISGKLRLVQRLRLVKTAHHGSDGAFSEDAWSHHAAGELVELAIVTRFNKGLNPPPHTSGLAPLRRFARRLALTSEPAGGWKLVYDGGWVSVSHPSGPGSAACVAVTLTAATPANIALSAQGALFAPTSDVAQPPPG